MTDQIAPAVAARTDGRGAPIAPWPGTPVWLSTGEVFVRSAPAAPGAEPALFVHGLGGSALNWTDLMGSLPLACEALDLPGFGYSPPPAEADYSIDAPAAALG